MLSISTFFFVIIIFIGVIVSSPEIWAHKNMLGVLSLISYPTLRRCLSNQNSTTASRLSSRKKNNSSMNRNVSVVNRGYTEITLDLWVSQVSLAPVLQTSGQSAFLLKLDSRNTMEVIHFYQNDSCEREQDAEFLI